MSYKNTFLIFLFLFLSGCGHHLYHRVEEGDTLYSISWQYGYDYKTIARWNDIQSPYYIKKGQVIHLAPQTREVDRRLLNKDYETAESKVVEQDSTAKKTTPQPKPKVITSPPARVSQTPRWQWPAEGQVIAGFKKTSGKHNGISIKGISGQTIRAAATGKVVYSGNALKGYGNLVIIKHGDDYLSAYAHNKDIFVREGEHVAVGQKIAAMGQSDSERVALYFEIRKSGKPVNPSHYLPKK